MEWPNGTDTCHIPARTGRDGCDRPVQMLVARLDGIVSSRFGKPDQHLNREVVASSATQDSLTLSHETLGGNFSFTQYQKVMEQLGHCLDRSVAVQLHFARTEQVEKLIHLTEQQNGLGPQFRH